MEGIRKHKPRTAKASAATASKLQKSNYITHPAAAIGWILASGEYIEASRHQTAASYNYKSAQNNNQR